MNILLVQPWIEDFAAFDFWIKPLALIRWATFFHSLGHQVTLVDCLDRHTPPLPDLIRAQKGKDRGDGRGNFLKTILPKPADVAFVPRRYGRYGIPIEMFHTRLAHLDAPDLICVSSGMTYWVGGLRTTVNELQQWFPQAEIAVGGIAATLFPEAVTQIEGIDFVHRGPDPQAFFGFLESSFPEAFPASKNLLRAYTQSLLPDWRLAGENHLVAVVETSRGCPFRCEYCASSMLHPQWVPFAPEAVVTHIAKLHHTCGISHIAFYDDALFHRSQSHIKAILKGVIHHNLKLSFHTPNGLFPRYIDMELAELMRASGFSTVRLSLDPVAHSGSQANRKVQIFHLEQAFSFLEHAGYARRDLEVYLLAGAPEQCYEHLVKSLHRVAELGGISRIATYSPVPGSRDFKHLAETRLPSLRTIPQLHNPTVFAYCNPNLAFEEMQKLIALSAELNAV